MTGSRSKVIPLDHKEYGVDIVATLTGQSGSRFNYPHLIRLLNFPRSDEQLIYSDYCTLFSRNNSLQTSSDWTQLGYDLSRVERLLYRKAWNDTMSPSDFQTILSKQGCNGASMIGTMCDTYRASHDLQNNVTTELQLLQAGVHTHFLSFRSLRRLAVENTDFMGPTFMQDLDRIVNANRGLQEVNIVVQEVNLLCQLESFLNMWRDSLSHLLLILLKRTKDNRG